MAGIETAGPHSIQFTMDRNEDDDVMDLDENIKYAFSIDDDADENGIADAGSMCRPFIMDPYLVKKIKQGMIEVSGCTSCNGCIGRRKDPSLLECVLI